MYRRGALKYLRAAETSVMHRAQTTFDIASSDCLSASQIFCRFFANATLRSLICSRRRCASAICRSISCISASSFKCKKIQWKSDRKCVPFALHRPIVVRLFSDSPTFYGTDPSSLPVTTFHPSLMCAPPPAGNSFNRFAVSL